MRWLLRFALLLFPAMAWAGSCGGVPCVGPIKTSFCALTSIASATKLTACTNGIPAQANFAYITAGTASVNWTDDGTVPTTSASGGQLLSAGSAMWYSVGEGALGQIQFISATGFITVSFYR